MAKVKWFKRNDGMVVKVSNDKTKARLELDKNWEAIAAPKAAKGEGSSVGKQENERDNLGEDLKKAEQIEKEVNKEIREDAAKANEEAEDIKEAEEEKKTVSKNVPLTTDKRVKKQ